MSHNSRRQIREVNKQISKLHDIELLNVNFEAEIQIIGVCPLNVTF